MVWQLHDLPDLRGKVIVITGATSGIGKQAAIQFAKRNAKLVLLARNKQKMISTAATIRHENAAAQVELIHADISDLDSVRTAVAEFTARNLNRIDVLLLNAGIAYGPYTTSAQRIESMFATNHLGHWLLTGLLIDYIRNVADSRIIAVSSLAHRFVSHVDYDVVTGVKPHRYNQILTYACSKLANHLFITELNARLLQCAASTVAVVAHPGCATTGLQDKFDEQWLSWIVNRTFSPLLCQSAAQGAWPLLMAATDRDVRRGRHYGPGRFFEIFGAPISDAYASAPARDAAKAAELWRVSERLSNFTYPISR